MGLIQKIEDGTATVGVIGLGYVGLRLALEMAEAGFKVLGVDVSQDKVDGINQGRSHIIDVPGERVAEAVQSGRLEATTDFSLLAQADAVSICVPTPLDSNREPDISYIESAARSLAPHMHPGMLVTLESTTYPGTTREVLQPILEESGLVAGKDFYLAFSPERVDPGNPVYNTKNTPKVVGGIDAESTRVAAALYGKFVSEVVEVSSSDVAEMTKLLENIFRCVNIALVNELLMLGERMGYDIWEVVEAARTKPFGFMAFYPGPGLGGHCIPIDPFYLSWKAKQYDFNTEFIELAGKTNEGMPYYVVNRLQEALNERGKALSTSRVLVLGVAYKPDIDDVRESPALKIMEILDGRVADLAYHDPHVPEVAVAGSTFESVPLDDEVLAGFDAAVLVTNHSSVDHESIARAVPLVLDTRNALRGCDAPGVVRL